MKTSATILLSQRSRLPVPCSIIPLERWSIHRQFCPLHFYYLCFVTPNCTGAVVDNGYKGHDPTMSKPNPLDSREVSKFKGRVHSHQECFNTRLKVLQALKQQFGLGEEKHGICFEAVCVICQYQLENGSPLFDV